MLTEGRLDLAEGLVGDSWRSFGSSGTPDGSANPDMQLTLMNTLAIALVAQDESVGRSPATSFTWIWI